MYGRIHDMRHDLRHHSITVASVSKTAGWMGLQWNRFCPCIVAPSRHSYSTSSGKPLPAEIIIWTFQREMVFDAWIIAELIKAHSEADGLSAGSCMSFAAKKRTLQLVGHVLDSTSSVIWFSALS